MNSLLSGILSSLLVYRYTALFFITFFSSLGFPLPAAPSVIAASAFAGQGFLNIFWVMTFGLLGNVLGDLTMYWLTKKYGLVVLDKFRLTKLKDSPALQNVEKTVEAYKAYVIILSRFQVQTTALVNIIAGLGKMNARRFFIFVFIGEFLQMIFYISIGYLFADSWQVVFKIIGGFGWIVALALTIAITYASGKIINKKSK